MNKNILYLSAQRHFPWVVLGIIVSFTIVTRINFFEIPFERDEGFYTYFGKMILDGTISFKDSCNQGISLVYYFYSFIISIFGYSVKAMHKGFLFVNILTLITIYLIGRNLLN